MTDTLFNFAMDLLLDTS